MRILGGLAIALLMIGCGDKKQKELKQGVWRGVIDLQGKELPFNFAVRNDSLSGLNVFIKNAEENLLLNEATVVGDSMALTLHIFDAVLRFVIHGDSLIGFYIRNDEKNYRLPFKAAYNQDYRFAPTEDKIPSVRFDGKYAVTFINESDTTQAVGIFEQKAGNVIEGTFLTPTGDYRYLEGNIIKDTMYLSTFDGNHLYLFTATKTSHSTLVGEYWSGKSWYQRWTGSLNSNASLPAAESLTYLKDGFDKIDFSFPTVNKIKISPTDDKYKNKVLILQLSGSWCPNCMDETKFLSNWYNENKGRGVEIIGLAYEAQDDFEYASSRVKKMVDRLNVKYDYVIAGTKDKEEASKTLPMLNRVVAFPTTIFIGKDGKVKKIHTGFNGPGTGVYYQRDVEMFNETVNELLEQGQVKVQIQK